MSDYDAKTTTGDLDKIQTNDDQTLQVNDQPLNDQSLRNDDQTLDDQVLQASEQTLDNQISQDNDYDIPDEIEFSESSTRPYMRLSDKYSDVMSSATTMLVIGILGLAFVLLVLLNVIPIPLNIQTAWLFYLVLSVLFIVFVIAGIVSFRRAGQIKTDAKQEDFLIENVLGWAKENIKKDYLDEDLDLSQSEELLYFERSERIQSLVMHQFEDLDESLSSELCEQIYQNIYES